MGLEGKKALSLKWLDKVLFGRSLEIIVKSMHTNNGMKISWSLIWIINEIDDSGKPGFWVSTLHFLVVFYSFFWK